MLNISTTTCGDVTLLCVEGRIVRGETDTLIDAVRAQAATSMVVLDLAHVNMIDAGGLGVMLELRELTESRGIEFRLENVTHLVKRILEITRLDTVFQIGWNKFIWPSCSSTTGPALLLVPFSCH
jgi:anti-anti-sigma factor